MWTLIVTPYDKRLFYYLGGLRSPIFALLHCETSQFESRQWWSHRFDNIWRYLVHSTLYVGSAWLSSTFRWHQCLNSWTILVTWLKDVAERHHFVEENRWYKQTRAFKIPYNDQTTTKHSLIDLHKSTQVFMKTVQNCMSRVFHFLQIMTKH